LKTETVDYWPWYYKLNDWYNATYGRYLSDEERKKLTDFNATLVGCLFSDDEPCEPDWDFWFRK
jgi:hypothetical protein